MRPRLDLGRRELAKLIGASALAACAPGADRALDAAPTVGPLAVRSRGVTRVVTARSSVDGAGVKLRRSLGAELAMLDPFLLLDEIHSENVDDFARGVPRHPHRGFETVTYVLEGAVEHKDSLGNSGHLGAGSAQWMTAGHGIVHAEMPSAEPGRLWAFQLWVNLPASLKMTRPRYQDIAPDRVSLVKLDGVEARVVAGELAGVRGPVGGIATAPTMADLAISSGGHALVPLPEDHAAFVYVFSGAATVGADATRVDAGELAVLGPGEAVALGSAAGARMLVVAGRAIGEPVARRGPFVMNTEEEIERAVDDYARGRLLDG